MLEVTQPKPSRHEIHAIVYGRYRISMRAYQGLYLCVEQFGGHFCHDSAALPYTDCVRFYKGMPESSDPNLSKLTSEVWMFCKYDRRQNHFLFNDLIDSDFRVIAEYFGFQEYRDGAYKMTQHDCPAIEALLAFVRQHPRKARNIATLSYRGDEWFPGLVEEIHPKKNERS